MSDIIKPVGGSNLPATMTSVEKGIVGALATFNQIRAFKMDAAEAISWMRTITRLFPDIEVDRVRVAVDGIISGEFDYDEKKGIRNITIAIKFTQWDGKNWVVKKPLI